MVLYFGVHKKIAAALDARALLIERLERRRLRDEAARCSPIIAAKRVRPRKAEHHHPCRGRRNLRRRNAEIGEGHFDRHEARRKIARAEADAVRESAWRLMPCGANLIAEKLTPDRAEKLVSESIDTLKSKLN